MENAQLIDWESDQSHVLLNPRMPEEERRLLQSFALDHPAHRWLGTTGTTRTL